MDGLTRGLVGAASTAEERAGAGGRHAAIVAPGRLCAVGRPGPATPRLAG
jgi:hypothetical protein